MTEQPVCCCGTPRPDDRWRCRRCRRLVPDPPVCTCDPPGDVTPADECLTCRRPVLARIVAGINARPPRTPFDVLLSELTDNPKDQTP